MFLHDPAVVDALKDFSMICNAVLSASLQMDVTILIMIRLNSTDSEVFYDDPVAEAAAA